MDMMRVGYALVVGCIFLAMVSAVTWLVFRRRARILNRFLAGRDVLARWEIPAQLWAKHVATDLAQEKQDRRMLFLITTGWAVVIGAGFVLYDFEAGRWVAAVLGMMLFVLVPFAFWLPKRRAARLLQRPACVVIGREGVYAGGELHDWRLAGSTFGQAEIDDQSDPKQLRIHYSYIGGRGVPIACTVRLPIPQGKEAEALHVAQELSRPKSG
jgi:hypothetical protein